MKDFNFGLSGKEIIFTVCLVFVLVVNFLQSREIKELNSEVRQIQKQMSKQSNKAPPPRL